jgi:hypothetical protein
LPAPETTVRGNQRITRCRASETTEVIQEIRAGLCRRHVRITYLFVGNLSISTVEQTIDAAVPAELGVLSLSAGSACWDSVSLATVALLVGIHDGVAANLVLARAAAAVAGCRIAIIALLAPIQDVVAAFTGLTITRGDTVPIRGTCLVATSLEGGSVQACGRGRDHEGDEHEQCGAPQSRKQFVWIFHAITS